MSTHRLISGRQRNVSLPTFSILGGLFIALQLWLSLSHSALAAPQQPPQQDVARAGVSVVRLFVTYQALQNTSPLVCTGLGVMVDSVQNATDQTYTNWILTDANLINKKNASCSHQNKALSLLSIDIFASHAYNSDLTLPLGTFSDFTQLKCLPLPIADCTSGAVLLPFKTEQGLPQPFIDSATRAGNADKAIALAASESNPILPPFPLSITPTALAQQKTGFLAPSALPTSDTHLELGTPIVNINGDLTGMKFSTGSFSATTVVMAPILRTLTGSAAANPVHDNWKAGLDAYYKVNGATTDYRTPLQAAFQANAQFTGADIFSKQAPLTTTTTSTKITPAVAPTPTSQSPISGLDSTIPIPGSSLTIPLWQILLLILVLLVVIVLGCLLFFNRKRLNHQRALDAELAELHHRAEADSRVIAEREAAERARVQQDIVQQSPILSQAPTHQLPPNTLLCPRCKNPVEADANFCPHCRLALSPSESGLHLKVQPAQMQMPPYSAQRSSSMPPIPDQQTLVPLNSLADQQTMITAPSLADQPTLNDLSGSKIQRGGLTGKEKTVQFSVRQSQGNRLGLVVGTSTDPGIKRKYKPNEDSVFAAQGMLNTTQNQQVFGLFVVADGMGGHAQGEDASQLAVQSIINHVLPKLLKDNTLQGEAYAKLLVEGIQAANVAVHNHNMELHGDMGTTTTAALLVGNVAYVTNVGDSRTYLYREPNGLQKVTNDHSVVASLVEAGIIKPDDIYTHPKRNQIYRSLGEKPLVEIDHFTVQLQAGDKLLLCSDGLWDMVRDPQIEAVVKSPASNPVATGEGLIQEALANGGEDNVSVIVVQVTEQGSSAGGPPVQLLYKPDSVQMPSL